MLCPVRGGPTHPPARPYTPRSCSPDTPEELIKPVHDPEQILTLLDQMDEETTAAACPVLRKQHPNTYTFTKSVCLHCNCAPCS